MSVCERTFRIAGQSFGVRSDSARFLRQLGRLLLPFPRSTGAAPGHLHYEVDTRPEYRIRKGRRRLFCCSGLDDALEFVEAELYSQLIRLLDRYLLFHAGAVWRAGTLLILPAEPGQGKTTLVAGLIKRGCLYLTDEMLILHPGSLSVRPFPKPLNMKHGSLALFPEPGPELGPLRPSGSLHEPRRRIHHMLVRRSFRQRGRLAPGRVAVLFPSYAPGRRADLRHIERVEAVRRLSASCYNHYRFGARFLGSAERLTRGAPCASLRYGRLEEALEMIDDRIVPLAPAPLPTPATA